jgi:3-dehydroquinate dehydratase-1
MNSFLKDLEKTGPFLVASLDGDDLPFLLEEARTARADMAEIRMDLWSNFFREDWAVKMARFKEKIRLPLLVSFRGGKPFPPWWLPVHWKALSAASLIDVEWNAAYPWREITKQARDHKVALMISHHDYQKTPSLRELTKIVKKAYGKKADIVKIATRVQNESDVRTLFELNNLFGKRLITVMGMGPLGALSRFVAPLFNSCLVYGYIGTPTASGQLPFRDLQERMRAFYPRYDSLFQERSSRLVL